MKLGENWRDLWSLDPRAIALARIALGLILVFDLVSRLHQADVLYGANAMLPPHMTKGAFPAVFDLYLLSDQLWVTQALISLNIAAALCWLIGYRSRLALLLTWFLYASLFYRNSLIHSGAEPTLLGALFWLMWLPHSQAWSVDSFKNQSPNVGVCLSAGSVAFVLQIAVYYFFSGLHKSDPIWWQQGSALYYALNLDVFSSPSGQWLLNYPNLIQIASYFIWWMELLAPTLLILLPLLFGPTLRTLAAIALIGLHFGIAIFMQIGIFPYVNIAILLALLPIKSIRSAKPSQNKTQWLWLISLLTLISSQIAYASLRYTQQKPPRVIKTALQLTTLENPYRFFAPKPPLQERFWFLVGITDDGSEVDVANLSPSPVVFDKQNTIQRWDRFHQRYFTHWARKGKRAGKLRAQFARYLCNRWFTHARTLDLPSLKSVALRYQLEITADWQSNKEDFVYNGRGHHYICRSSAPNGEIH